MNETVEPQPPLPNAWLRPELLRSWTEFLLVAAVLIGLPIRSSTSAALHGSSSQFIQLLLTDQHVAWAIVLDSGLLALFLCYLAWRGWRPMDFRINLGFLTSLQGVALLIVAYLNAIAVFMALLTLLVVTQGPGSPIISHLVSSVSSLKPHSVHLTWLAIVTWIVINAFLEELTCMGYVFNQLAARWNPRAALAITVFLRMACHTYQDALHLVGIGVLFSIFAGWYWIGRKLWPLIFAHILLDLISVSYLKLHLG